jgi:hypothetical protein
MPYAARASRRLEVTPEELERLVWEMPTTLFAGADKAVEKRCKKHGIQKPPRGIGRTRTGLMLK